MTRMKLFSLLLTLAFLICGGLWPRRASAAPMAPSLPPLFCLPECDWDDFGAEWALPVIEFGRESLIVGRDTWLGPDDLSAQIQAGWCAEGLLVQVRVRDAEVVVPYELKRNILRVGTRLCARPRAIRESPLQIELYVQID